MFSLPTVEMIYNEYHKQTFYAKNGVYPKTIKNYSNLYNDETKVEYINYFIEFLKRNNGLVDWKLYIKALAQVFKQSNNLKFLGSFKGNKIYRDYIASLQVKKDNENDIKTDIISSLQFLAAYNKENGITFKEYFDLDKDIIPLALKHIYSGTVSVYFYACFPKEILARLFSYQEDVFQELFHLSKYEFLDSYFVSKRDNILSYPNLLNIVNIIEEKIINKL
jgi:hypothetical protein